MLHKLTRPLALVLALGATPALAQDAPATDGQAAPAGDIGSTYKAGSFDDWELRCVRTADGADPCQIYQLLKNAEGTGAAEISLFDLPAGGEAAAGASIITPLETLLNRDLTLQVVGAEAKRYPFTFCFATPVRDADGKPVMDDKGLPRIENGCVARVGFTAADIDAFRKGAEAKMTIFAIVAPNQPFTTSLSLKGFTAAYAEMAKANEKARAAGN